MKDEDFEITDLDISFEPRWMRNMNVVGKCICFVPVVVCELIGICAIAVIEKFRS